MRAVVLGMLWFLAPAAANAQSLEAISLPDGDRVSAPADSEAEASFVAMSMPMILDRVPAAERPGLPERIAAAYQRMHDRLGPQPSVWATSVQGRAESSSPPALIAAGDGDLAVVFLHGYGGNFTWPCALVAEAAAPVGATTICPSLDADAHWSGRDGLRVVRQAIALARSRGARRVVLAGLSNGGVGASRLARRLRRQVDGLVLLSGVARDARAPQPTLLVHGDHDRMVATGAARAFARRHHDATLTLLDGGHFALADHPDEVVGHIAAWLGAHRR